MAAKRDLSNSAHSKESTSGSEPGHERAPINPWMEALQTIGLSIVLAFGVRTFVAEARYIPSGSMLPTLEINDRLVIDKVSYRFKTPSRGDIVVFHPPAAAGAQFSHEAFIKRVIGLPDEVIEIKDGKVYADGVALTEPYTEAPPDYTWGPKTVPSGSYLMLGDNRNNSDDGHVWGFLPSDRIIGRATIRFWPLDRLAYLADPSYGD
ncbi:MAG: signal peptidase I [Phormidesmis priestleyi]|uniref:Signal peptidase I n=1 Tax=Phormidesmis priestleyi TaxID=268141 RepID=A0A2W4Z4L6_9CYAN|nr:MAG: signal peptidase I [Phormidesmis priestleyi]